MATADELTITPTPIEPSYIKPAPMPPVTPKNSLSPVDVFGGGMPVPVPSFLGGPVAVDAEEEEVEEDVSEASAFKFAAYNNAVARQNAANSIALKNAMASAQMR